MTDSNELPMEASADRRRRWFQLRKRAYQLSWGGRAFNETPVMTFLVGTPGIGNGYVEDALEANFDTELFRAGDPRVFDGRRLRDDETVRQCIRKSRAPSVVFVADGESDSAASLIARFSPARVLWFYESCQSFIHRASRGLDETAAREFVVSKNRQDGDALPATLASWADDDPLDASAIWALAWYAIHDSFRHQRLARRSAAHLISEHSLLSAPGPTMGGIFEIIGVGAARHRRMPSVAARSRVDQVADLPVAVREACDELQAWLDEHAENPADRA